MGQSTPINQVFADFKLRYEGDLCIFHAISVECRRWINERLSIEPWYLDKEQLRMECKRALPIAEKIVEAGFVMEVEHVK